MLAGTAGSSEAWGQAPGQLLRRGPPALRAQRDESLSLVAALTTILGRCENLLKRMDGQKQVWPDRDVVCCAVLLEDVWACATARDRRRLHGLPARAHHHENPGRKKCLTSDLCSPNVAHW